MSRAVLYSLYSLPDSRSSPLRTFPPSVLSMLAERNAYGAPWMRAGPSPALGSSSPGLAPGRPRTARLSHRTGRRARRGMRSTLDSVHSSHAMPCDHATRTRTNAVHVHIHHAPRTKPCSTHHHEHHAHAPRHALAPPIASREPAEYRRLCHGRQLTPVLSRRAFFSSKWITSGSWTCREERKPEVVGLEASRREAARAGYEPRTA